MATKWGIVSAGKISNDFVAAMKNLSKEDHQVVAVAARNISSAENFASKHNISKAYGSYKELAEDPAIEVVYVGCINSQHFPVSKLMLEHGKHVLVEKPLTLGYKQTCALIEIAETANRFLMEAIWSRCLPSYKCLMGLIDEKTIGDIVHVESSLNVPNLHKNANFKKSLGSGVLGDLGIYPLNIVCMIYREYPLKIAAVGHLNDEGIDVSTACSLQYSNNRTANIFTSALVEAPASITIIGTNGIIKVPDAMFVAKTIQTPQRTYGYPLPEHAVGHNYPYSSGLMYEAAEVRKCLKEGLLESPLMSLKDSKLLAKLIDDIRHQLGVVYEEED